MSFKLTLYRNEAICRVLLNLMQTLFSVAYTAHADMAAVCVAAHCVCLFFPSAFLFNSVPSSVCPCRCVSRGCCSQTAFPMA